MSQDFSVKFHKESEQAKKKRVRRYNLYWLRRSILFIFLLLMIFSVGYWLYKSDDFKAEIISLLDWKSKNTDTKGKPVKPQIKEYVKPEVSTVKVTTEIKRVQDEKEKYLGSKIIMGDTVQGYYGMSVSQWQHIVDWKTFFVKNDSMLVKFILIKATQGDTAVDKQFHQNWKSVAGKGLNIGAFHIFDPTVNALKQAKNYIKNVNLKKGNFVPVVKVETNYRKSLLVHEEGIDKKLNLLKTFLEELEKNYGVEPVVFTSHRFYLDCLKDKLLHQKYMFACYNNKPFFTMLSSVNGDAPFAPYVYVWQYNYKDKVCGVKTTVRKNFVPRNKYQKLIISTN